MWMTNIETLKKCFLFLKEKNGLVLLAHIYVYKGLFICIYTVCTGLLLLTCDSVWVEIPGLFCDVEDQRDKLLHPGGQFTKINW